ncbi:MAG: RnfABCDGE type electron transport complex subunit G [Firmicutes bacterium]|nr:RnfABCDGE type electron transport complex subunit G [Bacillota bacterium]
MNEIIKPAGILLIITAVAAALLGVVQSVTAEPIRISEEAAQVAAMQAALPEASSFEEIESDFGGTITSASKGLDGSGNVIGYVVTANPSGFGGAVPTTVGFDLDGVITGLQVTTPSETPGLGAVAATESFTGQFSGMSGELAVSKDGGQVQAITSATITSRAVVSGVNEAREWVEANGGAN